MEGGGYSSDEDFEVTRPPVFAKREEEEQVDGPSAKKRAKKTATPLPPASKLLVVEKKKDPHAPLGKLNPLETTDEDKRKSVTETSSVRDDQAFEPPTWYYFPKEEIQVEKRYPRDGRGIIFREVDLAEEFKVRYAGTCYSNLKEIRDEGVDLIKRTILDLVSTESLSSPQNIYEDSPEMILTQDEGLSDEQREQLFTAIFDKGGRVPIIDKPGWSLIIHRAPNSGIIHLCVEMIAMHKGTPVYEASRLCTKADCYKYNQTISTDVFPKCSRHQDIKMHSVVKLTPYNEKNLVIQMHVQFGISTNLGSPESDKNYNAELYASIHMSSSRSWIKYYPIKDARPIPEAISMYHYGTVEEALSRLALESTIGMFMKLALGTTPFVNLDDIIPLCYGMEKELDTRLKELGMHLKMRELSPAERMEVTYPFPGQYLLGTQAEKEQKPEKGKSFLYTITSRDMHYFGWSNTPDFKDRLRRGNRTDGANEYKRITEARAKLDGTRAPTVTSSLLAKCDVTDNTQIEAKMIIAGYVAYLLGLRNPLRKLPSGRGYSTNKCVSLSLVDSDSWSDICQFVKLFWGVEPILAKFDKDRGEMPNFIADSENYSDDKVENSEDEDYNPDEDEHNPEAGSSSSGDHSTDSNSDESD